MNLFESRSLIGTPLAERLRPKTLEDFLGPSQLWGPRSALRQWIEKGYLPNLILWGPPGTGKTTLARLIGDKFNAKFLSLNAVEAGAKQLKEAGEMGHNDRIYNNRRTLLFVDEIHRFNKTQQDILLPFLESGDLIFVGATTENPSYELGKALLSRSRILVFQKHSATDLRALLRRAFQELGLNVECYLNENQIESLISWSDGDARKVINAVEMIGHMQGPLSDDQLSEALGEKTLGYDKSGDLHYDTISAFIKSIRGSDPDAGLYYLARMLKSGEDPVFIARRLVILASEDVGNADPRALPLAMAGAQAVEMIGLPEAAINLAQVVTFLATAPKSNRSYVGLNRAKEFVEKTGSAPIPLSLRSAQTAEMKNLGYGAKYKYSHDFPKAWAAQNFLPEGIKLETPFYELSDNGYEKKLKEFLHWLKSN